MRSEHETGAAAERGGVAFLLAQLGAHAASRFASQIAQLDLTPPQAGLLRLLAVEPGRSQRELADKLGMPPSRFVPFADELERRGLIERRRNPTDRRLHALHLTGSGEDLLTRVRTVGVAHERQVCTGLSADEHQALLDLLRRVAEQQGLRPGIHPGYRWTRPERPENSSPPPDRRAQP